MAQTDRIRFEKQKADLDKKGYFVLDNGSKSNDEQNQPKQKKRKSLKKAESSDEEVPVKKPLKKKH